MKRIIKFIFLAGVAVALATGANAANFSLSGGTAGTIPGGATNEFIPGLFPGPIGGYFGSQIMVNALRDVSILTFEFFGAEAGYHNEFNAFSTELFDHPSGTNIAPDLASPLNTNSNLSVVGVGTLPFSFDINNNAFTLVNHYNPDDSNHGASGPNFFASFDPFQSTAGSGGTSGTVVYLFLDDGGAGPDDNHDDFLVRIAIKSVPEPSAMLLLGIGIVGLAAVGRKMWH